jgi:hypothetical protein
MQGTAGAIQVLHGLLYFVVAAQIKQNDDHTCSKVS